MDGKQLNHKASQQLSYPPISKKDTIICQIMGAVIVVIMIMSVVAMIDYPWEQELKQALELMNIFPIYGFVMILPVTGVISYCVLSAFVVRLVRVGRFMTVTKNELRSAAMIAWCAVVFSSFPVLLLSEAPRFDDSMILLWLPVMYAAWKYMSVMKKKTLVAPDEGGSKTFLQKTLLDVLVSSPLASRRESLLGRMLHSVGMKGSGAAESDNVRVPADKKSITPTILEWLSLGVLILAGIGAYVDPTQSVIFVAILSLLSVIALHPIGVMYSLMYFGCFLIALASMLAHVMCRHKPRIELRFRLVCLVLACGLAAFALGRGVLSFASNSKPW